MKKKLCIIATEGMPLNVFMGKHIAMLSDIFEIVLIANTTSEKIKNLLNPNVSFIYLPITREINLISDLLSLYKLIIIFKSNKFNVVHSIMPKSGFIGMLAACIVGVPHRIHTFTGQVWANKVGIKKQILKLFDLLIVKFSTNILTDSYSQKNFLIKELIVKYDKISVLGSGSICGVDIERFHPDAVTRFEIRANIGIPHDSFVYLYLGRLNKDKGVLDLVQAFNRLIVKEPNSFLLIVGPDESNICNSINLILMKQKKNYKIIGFSEYPEKYMAVSDVICLPSYREGFGSVIIEAAAVGIPAIGSNIYGLIDAIDNGNSGLIHGPGNIKEIEECMIKIRSNIIYNKLKNFAYLRAIKYFDSKIIVDAMRQYYINLLVE